ncbi:glycine zipper family protein [Brevibacillus thermoruber]|uniref:glycine zipper family protein n=1 Tax=Brevibacillus thermoruber TaxID=33942 RepID=UPI0012E03B12|nr:glycine zipper family protein [Brevibacillus thermoruber]
MKQDERSLLCFLATQCLELTILSMYQYCTYNSFDLLKLNRSEFNSLKNANAVERVVETVFDIEEIPDFATMISKGMLDIKDIPKFRQTKGARQFRSWIDKVSHHTDKSDITREYIDAIVNSKGFFQTKGGKLLRTLGLTALGAVVGQQAGPIGAFSGAVVGTAIDLGLSLFDSYILEGITKGWTPRHYIEKQIKPLIKH